MAINHRLLKLQIITLLDSICFGLIYAVLAPYIVANFGADQFIVGILTCGSLLCSLLSQDIINTFAQIHGKRYALYMVLNTAMVTHLLIILTNNCWFTIFSRYIFCLTNQSQNLCRDLLLQTASEEEQDFYLMRFGILNKAGFIIGPFITGWIFDTGFEYVALLAMILTFINTYLLINIEMEEPSRLPIDYESVIEKNICTAIGDLKKANCNINWDVAAMKYLYVMSVIIFSTKYTQILKHNFCATQFVIGYTTSYMNVINFAATYFIECIKDKYLTNTSILIAVECGLIVTGISVLIACYAPIFSLYALMCLFIFLSYSFMNCIWKFFSMSRGNDSLYKIDSSINIIAGLTVPVLYGIVHRYIGYYATILFSTLPIFFSIAILRKYTFTLYTEDGTKLKEE